MAATAGWTALREYQMWNGSLRFHVDASVCANLRPWHSAWGEDGCALTLAEIDDVVGIWARSFDAQAIRSDDGPLVVQSDRQMSGSEMVGTARYFPTLSQTVVKLDSSRCWILNNATCGYVVTGTRAFFCITAATVGLALIAYALRRCGTADACPVMLVLGIAGGSMAYDLVSHCTGCFSFRLAMLHEVGHAVGLAHQNCTARSCVKSVMRETMATGDADGCIATDDALGACSVQSRSCNPAECKQTTHLPFWAQFVAIGAALLYAVCSTAFWKARATRAQRRRQRPRVHVGKTHGCAEADRSDIMWL